MDKLQIIRTDGQTAITVADDDFTQVAETRKTKDGQHVETGVIKRTFIQRANAKQLIDGEAVSMVLPTGETALIRELRITERYVSADQIARENATKRFENLIKDIRRFVGLSKSAKPVSASDKLTSKDLENWMNGLRKVKGYHFEELPADVQEKASKVYADSIKKTASKPATLMQLAEMAALAAENGTPLGDDWHKEFEAAKARASRLGKGKAAKAVEPEVELSEQGID